MDLELKAKTFLVTGAARGMGRAAVDMLAAADANVVAFDRNASALDELKLQLSSAKTLVGDVASALDVKSAIERCQSAFGRIDAVLHFAGVLDSKQLDDATSESFDAVQNVNLRGSFLVAQAAARVMREQRSGSIVFTASDSARMGSLVSGPAYAASKGGVIALARTLAVGLGPSGIRVNAVCPGLTLSDFSIGWSPEFIEAVSTRTPLRRLARPDEIAKVAIFLASGAASFITGEVVEVNGGIHFD
ncbi:SDR family NAD(P)-dependent oxidoreductase [Bradyrhizobium sp. 14AA]